VIRFTVEGQPPSWNRAYRIVRMKRKDGSSYMHMAKAKDIEPYQLYVSHMARQAKPAGWVPAVPCVVRYWFHLKRDIDSTNCLKILEDAIAIGLDVNDRIFLPQVMGKTTGNKEPYVEVEIE